MPVALVLASGSPRRLSLLQDCGLQPMVRVAGIDESVQPGEIAQDYVARLAREKNAYIRAQVEDQIVVIAADTTVVIDDILCGKPADFSQARDLWQRMGGRWHEVWTSVCVAQGLVEKQCTVRTRVLMTGMDEAQMRAYWASGEPVDKAGGYAIQGRGGVLVRAIEGSYSNVVGLPLAETVQLLREFDVAIWEDRHADQSQYG
ncbi:MAG: septum formation inhibitor Maf [Pseudomonadales bacterium]|nr:septum formation inhibitor Maf [Pseudomonadales bacterium]